MQHASAKSNAVQTVFATLVTMFSMVVFADVALAQDVAGGVVSNICLLYTSPSPRDGLLSRMPSSA